MATLVLITVTIPGQEKPLATSAPAYGLAERQLPPPSQGLLNDCLRTQSETFGDWDLGGQVRVRYEIKENGGIYPNFDFRRAGVDNDNAYLLLREKLHLGYAPCSWFGLFAEGRDNSAIGDERHPSPDADQVDLYQAFIRVGDPKQFPLTAKIGRQELIYGDERLVGNADWNTNSTKTIITTGFPEFMLPAQLWSPGRKHSFIFFHATPAPKRSGRSAARFTRCRARET